MKKIRCRIPFEDRVAYPGLQANLACRIFHHSATGDMSSQQDWLCHPAHRPTSFRESEMFAVLHVSFEKITA
eukprot:g31329.t1